jgi:hypothetical protein
MDVAFSDECTAINVPKLDSRMFVKHHSRHEGISEHEADPSPPPSSNYLN